MLTLPVMFIVAPTFDIVLRSCALSLLLYFTRAVSVKSFDNHWDGQGRILHRPRLDGLLPLASGVHSLPSHGAIATTFLMLIY